MSALNSRTISSISYVVPCYNEQACLNEFHRRFSDVAETHPEVNFQVIYINDGSTDGTSDILNEIATRDPRVCVLHLAWNSGHQKALCAGLDYVDADLVIVLDADLQDPPELVDEILDRVLKGYDLVHMQRRQRAGESWFKLFTAWLFYWLIRTFGDRRMIDNCGDFRGITRPVVHAIRYYREPHKYYRGLFATMGFRQTTIQYDRDARFAGETKYPLRKMLAFALDAIVNFSTLPLRLVITSALLAWGFSLVYLVHSMVEVFWFGRGVRGWSSIVVLMAAFTGLILSCLAIIGAYIRRIFEQGQNRPQYFVYSGRNIDLGANKGDRTHLRECQLSSSNALSHYPSFDNNVRQDCANEPR